MGQAKKRGSKEERVVSALSKVTTKTINEEDWRYAPKESIEEFYERIHRETQEAKLKYAEKREHERKDENLEVTLTYDQALMIYASLDSWVEKCECGCILCSKDCATVRAKLDELLWPKGDLAEALKNIKEWETCPECGRRFWEGLEKRIELEYEGLA